MRPLPSIASPPPIVRTGPLCIKNAACFFSPSPPTAAPARLRLALAPIRTPLYSCRREGDVGRVGCVHRVPPPYIVRSGLLRIEKAACFLSMSPAPESRP